LASRANRVAGEQSSEVDEFERIKRESHHPLRLVGCIYILLGPEV
jgi:hypothetical protein